jgi:hypothetical protein
MQKAKRYFSSKMLFRSAILLISISGFGCSAIRAIVIGDICDGKGSLYGYTFMINLEQHDSMYVRLSNKKASYMLPINNVPIEYLREFSKENIDAGCYELHLVKKDAMKYCGNIVIKADSTALLRIFETGNGNEFRAEISFIEKASFKKRGVIEGKVDDPAPPNSYGTKIRISQYSIWNTMVDSTGYFRIDNILPGTYSLSIYPYDISFTAPELKNIKVKNGEITKVKIYFQNSMLLPPAMPNNRKNNTKKEE